MGDSVGQVSLDLVLNSKEFESKLNNAVSKATSDISGKMNKSLSKTGALLGNIGKLVGGAFAVGAIVNFGKECVNLGSDLAEVQNVVDSTFTTMSDKVNEYAETSITRLGMSETSYKKMMGTMGAMSKSFGFTEAEALNMADSITSLTADVASFYNLSHDEAYTKMKSIYTGETESLKDLGVVMTQTALDEFALANGFGKTTKAMTEQEKVALRYQFVMKNLETASGDFMRTSDGWSNQTRILSQQFDKLKSTIGQSLISAILPVIRVLNSLIAKIQVVADAFSNLTSKIFGKAETSTGAISSTIADVGASAVDTSEAIGGIADATTEAAKKVNKTVFGFDQLNTLQAPDTSSGGGASTGIGAGISTSIQGQQKLNEQTSIYESSLDRVISKAKELSNIFLNGFKLGLDTTNFNGAIESIKNSLASIKDSLINIFTDGSVVGALDNLVNTITFTFGSMVGTVVGVATAIGNALVSGIAEYLDNNKDFLKEKFANIMNGLAETTTIVGQAILDVGQILADTFNSSQASTLISNFISIIVNPFLEFKDLCIQVFNDIIGGLGNFLNRYKEEITVGLQNTFAIVGDILKGAETIILDIIEILRNAYETSVKPVLDNLGTRINELMDKYIIPLGNTFVECWNKIADNLKIIWDGVLKPFLDWLINKLVKDIMDAVDDILYVASVVLGRFIEFVDGMIRIFSGLIDFIVGVFTADWQKAWQGIKDIVAGLLKQFISIIGLFIDTIGQLILKAFIAVGNGVKDIFMGIYNTIKNIFNGLINIIKTPMNALISMVNKAIDGINGMSIDVPDWVPGIGGETYGFSLPKVPMLANGGYITAPQLAMVGEAGPEIVAPEHKMRQIEEEGANSTNLLLAQMIEQNKQMIQVMSLLLNKDTDVYLDRDKVGAMLTNYQNSETRRRG